MKRPLLLVLSLLTLPTHPLSSHAQWAPDGVVFSAGAGNQSGPQAAVDGAGGVFVTWTDSRNGHLDIYAQRVNGDGVRQWVDNGVAVRSAINNQSDPRIVSDGAGGAVIVWVEGKNNGSTDIVAQRIDATGAAQWAAAGVTVCGAQNDQQSISAIPDGTGGAIVVWQDTRDGDFSTADIYAQHVNSAGTNLWLSDGVPVCTEADQQSFPVLADDGAGGAIISWSDRRSGLERDIYAQRLNLTGTPQWTTNGVVVCNASSEQDVPGIAVDGAGGAFMAWTDARLGATDIYAQRVDPSGAALWTEDGVVVCDAGDAQSDPHIISQSGVAVVTWNDARDVGTNGTDVYAQSLNGSGASLWPEDGALVCNAANNQQFARLLPAGYGAVVITWMDTRDGGLDYDIYAQRLSATGAVQWTGNGVALCTAANGQFSPTIATDGFGGAIVAWQDYRGGSTYDVYGNRITQGGMIPTAVGRSPAVPSITVGNAYPNPFSTGTAFDLTLARAAVVRVEIFDVGGRRVRAVDLGRLPAGATRVAFDGRDAAARPLPSGVYFCRVHAAHETITRKLVIQR